MMGPACTLPCPALVVPSPNLWDKLTLLQLGQLQWCKCVDDQQAHCLLGLRGVLHVCCEASIWRLLCIQNELTQ